MISSEDCWVTPTKKFRDLPKKITLDDKIDVFSERINGWKIDIAADLSSKRDSNTYYAILDILLSYFEMIAKYNEGYTGTESRRYFKKGLRLVFPDENKNKVDEHLLNKLLESLYSGARCGAYHIGFPSAHIFLEDGTINPIKFFKSGRVTINPHQLVKVVRWHFNDYIKKLKDTNNHTLRQNFEKRFDFDTSITK